MFLVWYCRRVKVRMRVSALMMEMMKRMVMKRRLLLSQFMWSLPLHPLHLPRILSDNCLKKSWRRRSWLSLMPCWLSLVLLGTNPRMKKVLWHLLCIFLVYAFSFVYLFSLMLCLSFIYGGNALVSIFLWVEYAKLGFSCLLEPPDMKWCFYENWMWFVHIFHNLKCAFPMLPCLWSNESTNLVYRSIRKLEFLYWCHPGLFPEIWSFQIADRLDTFRTMMF